MLTENDFIVFSDDWGRHPFSCQHIMKHFLPGNRLLWVNTIGMRRPQLNLKDVRRGLEKISSWMQSAPADNICEKNLTVISPFMIPYNNVDIIRKFNKASVISKVRTSMQLLGMKNPILLTTLPNTADYLGAFDECLTVYYCVDEFAEWPGVDANLVYKMEPVLLKNADIVVAVSDELMKRKTSPVGPTYLLTHGVDVEHFQKAANTISPGTDELSAIPHPIIGYFGLFDERSDQDLLEQILKQHPDWSLVIIGKIAADISRLNKYDNFYTISAVPYEKLPGYVAFFDVCILPYVRSTLTDNINPLKIKEYIASGKPIVTTALPEAVKMEPLVAAAYNHQDFLSYIEQSLKTPPDPAKQIERIKGERWQNKAQQFSDWIEDALQIKGSL